MGWQIKVISGVVCRAATTSVEAASRKIVMEAPAVEAEATTAGEK